MTTSYSKRPQATRRGFLSGGARLAALAGASLAANPARALDAHNADAAKDLEPFWGPHQGGVVTPAALIGVARAAIGFGGPGVGLRQIWARACLTSGRA